MQPQWSSQDLRAIAPEEFARESDRIRSFQADEARRRQGEPCPFLAQDPAAGPGAGRCTIYASRPLACRQLVNLDRDALLCHLVPGRDVQVPYLNVRQHAAIQMEALGIGQRFADIRAWFGATTRPADAMDVMGSDALPEPVEPKLPSTELASRCRT